MEPNNSPKGGIPTEKPFVKCVLPRFATWCLKVPGVKWRKSTKEFIKMSAKDMDSQVERFHKHQPTLEFSKPLQMFHLFT